MVKKINRREFIQLAALGTVYAGSGVLLSSCQEKSDTTEPQITETLSVVKNITTHSPLGVARGVNPGRVVWAHSPDATRWDGHTSYWWAPESIDQPIVDEMFRQSLYQLAGSTNEGDAWAKIFRHFNVQKGRSESGYQPGEKIAVKINLNTCTSHVINHNNTFSAPHAILAILKQLVDNAGVNPADIVIYDAVRYIPDCIYDTCKVPMLEGLRFADFAGGNGREKSVPDSRSTIHWSVDVGGSMTYLPACVTQADYLINLSGLKGHRLAGTTLCAKNHCGTILAELDNKPTMQAPQGANIHGYIAAKDYGDQPGWIWKKRPMGSYNALVDMMGHHHLGEKTLLFIVDGLFAAPHQQAELNNSARWQSAPFNDNWTSSLFLSMDGVAIDSVAYDFITNEPTIANNPDVMPPGHTAENYLHEAAQADAPVSGTVYCPDGESHLLNSLGTHEHWDDASTRQYSRNYGEDKGIELISIS